MQLPQAFHIQPGEVVAFVGGGGKTSTMFGLAEALAQTSIGRRVLTTTSTRIFAAQIKLAPAHVIFEPARQSLAELLPALQAALDRHGQVLLIGQTEPETGKAFGIPPELIDRLAATGLFDVILNEADGSRMRPFKAPAGHEPVIPVSSSLVVPVVGLDVLARPLSDDTVHRAKLVSELSGTPLTGPVTVETVATVLSHAQGGLKNVPEPARVIPLLNKAESPLALAAARQIATTLLQKPRFDRVAIGAVKDKGEPIREVQGRTAVVILAAGGSSRFGSPKQLARWAGQTFIERAVTTALAAGGVHSVTVVLGAEVEQSRRLLQPFPVEVVVNPHWPEGQSSSMQAGLTVLPATVDSVIFLLVDLPLITPDIIEALIRRYRQTLAPIVWPEFAGQRGNPVLFDRTLFPQLSQIKGDTGGRPLLQAYQDQAERVVVTTPAVLQDVDRPEDVAGMAH
jgi:molybdenum cofactor cytidylyltransferase